VFAPIRCRLLRIPLELHLLRLILCISYTGTRRSSMQGKPTWVARMEATFHPYGPKICGRSETESAARRCFQAISGTNEPSETLVFLPGRLPVVVLLGAVGLYGIDPHPEIESERPTCDKCDWTGEGIDSGHAQTSGMIEGIEKAFVVVDIFLGALNEAALLIGLAQDQMNPAQCGWDRPSFLASSPRLVLNQAAQRVLHPSERRKPRRERFSNEPKSQD